MTADVVTSAVALEDEEVSEAKGMGRLRAIPKMGGL
jgi:hypothetical protein